MRRVDFCPWEYDPASPEGRAQAALHRELTDDGARICDGVFIPQADVARHAVHRRDDLCG